MVLTRIELVLFESPLGYGVYTARAAQLANIVSRMSVSKGVQSGLRKHTAERNGGQHITGDGNDSRDGKQVSHVYKLIRMTNQHKSDLRDDKLKGYHISHELAQASMHKHRCNR